MENDTEKLAALEREIDQATERLWDARLASKKAKVLVKAARKARKQLRKEYLRLQETASGEKVREVSEKGKSEGAVAALKVADSPEKSKAPRKKVKLPPAAPAKESEAKETPQ